MSDSTSSANSFLGQLTAVIEKNMANEQFGVSELADEMNMSRSNLLRKVKKETKLSVSQLINQVRLKQAMELLRKSTLNVSEVAHKVGFGSPSYFIKCFREYYGYPPGEVGKRSEPEEAEEIPIPVPVKTYTSLKYILLGAGLVAALTIGFLTYKTFGSADLYKAPAKSIAVLPFKNESNDSTNVYLINGLMESTLNNLQHINELRVVSRTTAEKYRNTTKSIPEMAKELGVNYFVEGSGQKIGDRILLNIQLIEAATDKHIWSKQYRRETKDIFELQQEIAKNIAQEIEAVITPEEKERIEKIPTENLEAYDLYLKGRALFYESTSASLFNAVPNFEKAIELDPKFALAYANAVMVYYYLDIFRADKQYTEKINTYADKTMLLEPKLAESLIAKALAYAHKKEYAQAVPYLERALEYKTNDGLVIHFLTEFYSMYVPNRAKYIEYAFKGADLDTAVTDSATYSFKYFHVGNALVQAGFVDESLYYMEKSLAYNPHNTFARYVIHFVRFAKNRKLINETRDALIREFNKDTTRVDIAAELGRTCTSIRDYTNAFKYYKKLEELLEKYHLDIFQDHYLDMAIVFEKMGDSTKSATYRKRFKEFCDNNKTIYKHMFLCTYYAYLHDSKKCIEHLKLFSKEDNYQYWFLFITDDPVMESVKDLPEFKKVMSDMETRFWKDHEAIRENLEEQGLIQ